MKKLFIILSSVTLFASCNNSSDTKSTTDTKVADTTTAAPAPAAETKDPEAEKGLALVAKSDCFSCHKLKENSTGPAYSAVAAKFKNADPATIDSLVQKVIKGGSGSWGEIPMAPHPNLPKEDVKSMIHYVLSIKS